MEGENKPNKNFLWAGLVAIAVLVLFSAYLYFNKETPYLSLSPENYPAGTMIDLYKNIPPDFPKEVVLEDKTLDYSGTVQNPDGRQQMTISYISEKSMSDIADMYISALPERGWSIADSSKLEKVSIVQISKGSGKLTITIAPIKDGETMVTFQYEK